MASNPNFSDEDVILGVMVGAQIEDLPGNPIIPDRPIPTIVWAILWNRIEQARQIIEDVQTGYLSWKASFEIGNRSEDEILLGDEFFSFSDASDELLEKIGPSSVGSLNGKKIALVLGGRDGFVDYWGAGLTLTPADRINPEVELETASINKKKFVFLSSAVEKVLEKEKASFNKKNQKNIYGGDFDMTEEEKKKMMEDFKKQLANLSPSLRSVIEASGIDASKAKSVIEGFEAEIKSKVEEVANKIENKFNEGFIEKVKHESILKDTVDKAIASEIPKARKEWELEQTSIINREKQIADAKIPLTEARKEKIKTFAFDDEGNKEFESYISELKEVANLKVNEFKPDNKNKNEIASIGSILNTNKIADGDEDDGTKKPVLASLFR